MVLQEKFSNHFQTFANLPSGISRAAAAKKGNKKLKKFTDQ
jgi:hypothetical protein